MEDHHYIQLRQILSNLESVVVAYSGGTDSTVLLKVAYDVLGERAIGITLVSPSLPQADRREAEEIARQIGVRHLFLESEEMDDPDYLANTPNRCYFCKKESYGKLTAYAQQHGYKVVVDGTNADDQGDYRPGRRAAQQYGIRSPLLEAGLTKAEIRQLARALDLPNWNKPSAACLASRLPYGTPITASVLAQVEQAEAVLHQLGLRQLRVRHHGVLARLEVSPADFPLILEKRAFILSRLQSLGYTYVALDLAGFRSGSMNEVLSQEGFEGPERS